MKKRVVALFSSLLLAFGAIIARLYTISESELKQAAQAQSTIKLTVASVRGTIYDRNLTPLTNTEYEYKAAVTATEEVLAALSKNLPSHTWASIRERLTDGKPQVLTLNDRPILANGMYTFSVPKRYATVQNAPHLIGYVGDDGLHGVSGIEKAFDEELIASGGKITVTYTTNGKGEIVTDKEPTIENTIDETMGGIALTIDRNLQQLTEDIGGELLRKGAVVILDPKTGEILSMASFPNFQPSRLSDYLTGKNSPLFNRSIAAYNCGSVFKIATAAAALENGITSSQSFSCTGSIPVGNDTIKCHYSLGHGWQTLTQGFVNSCNPYFIQLAAVSGGASLYRMASDFSFTGALTLASGYQTASAVFPELSKMRDPSALAALSFGQGELMATPIHIAQLTASVVNGGSYVPSTVFYGTVAADKTMQYREREAGVQTFSAATATQIKAMMIEMVQSHLGESARPSHGGAGGKTGTAETGWLCEDGSTMVQSWFTGFYPAENPQYVITVVSEDAGHTKQQAAPVFRELCDGLYRMSKAS